MSHHLVVGAGLIGTSLTRHLLDRGDQVALASRSGTQLPGAEAVRLDASDADALALAANGAETIFLVTNPREYHRWPELWPPVFHAAIDAARRSSARLVIMGNLYAYGESSIMPMTEHGPLLTTEAKGLVRKAGWELAKAAHDRGEIQAVEVRASDYFGPGAEKTAQLGAAFFRPVMAGKATRVFGSTTEPHSWSYLPDIVSTLAAAADYRGDWGRAWHVPTAEPLSRQQIAQQVNELTGSRGSVAPMPEWFLRALGLVVPLIRAANDSLYQFTRPFVIDASETERLLGVHATPWEESLPATVNWYRSH